MILPLAYTTNVAAPGLEHLIQMLKKGYGMPNGIT